MLLLLTMLPAAGAGYSVLDVQSVPLWGDPSQAVVRFTVPDHRVAAHGGAAEIADMHHAAVLDVRAGPVADGGQITSQHRREPDGHVVAEGEFLATVVDKEPAAKSSEEK